MTLTEFLLARIAEDEATARERGADAMTGHRWKHAPENVYQELQDEVLRNARRTMAECKAKRRIVEGATYEMGLSTAQDWLFPLLTLPYADHPDYRQEWKPESTSVCETCAGWGVDSETGDWCKECP